MLGAAIVLPDHPQIAPESRGNLFDTTEIEEALLLHVQALSDAEREEIAEQDPAVREMIERAARRRRREEHHAPARRERPTDAATRRERRGRRSSVDGVVYRRGGEVVLRPGPDARPARPHARRADRDVERIYVDYDGRVHLGVTVDDDPGQDLMRETGRYLFFKPDEVRGAHERTCDAEQILVAGVGNAWLQRRRLRRRGRAAPARRASCPTGVPCSTSAPAGSTSPTRSCAATTRWCSSTSAARAASPGTLYVMEPDPRTTSRPGSRTAR